MTIKTVRRLAADILKVGENRVYIDPERIEEAKSAMTRQDVKELIKAGVIRRKPKEGKRRGELRKRKKAGSRKGKKYSRKSKKRIWIERVRALRKLLRELVSKGELAKEHKKSIYAKIKGNLFKGKKSLLNYLKEHKLIRRENNEQG